MPSKFCEPSIFLDVLCVADITILANFNYHAPEQSVVGYVQRPTTDIYSLGLMLNAMITGVVPAGEDYKKIRDVDSDYSFLDSIVKKMISQNQDNRYQSIDEVLLDYEVRKKAAENELKIKSLREPLLLGEIHDKSIYKKVLKGKYYKNYRRRKIIEKNNEKPEFGGNNREIYLKADDKRNCSDVLRSE